jgi:hypothetical protein
MEPNRPLDESNRGARSSNRPKFPVQTAVDPVLISVAGVDPGKFPVQISVDPVQTGKDAVQISVDGVDTAVDPVLISLDGVDLRKFPVQISLDGVDVGDGWSLDLVGWSSTAAVWVGKEEKSRVSPEFSP